MINDIDRMENRSLSFSLIRIFEQLGRILNILPACVKTWRGGLVGTTFFCIRIILF